MQITFCGGQNAAFLTKEDLEIPPTCCVAAGVRGPEACTCWQPLYSGEQHEPQSLHPPEPRINQCGDCAYLEGSPEKTNDPEALEDMPIFYCHVGMRKIVAWIHPDGRRREVSGDYRPLVENGIPYKANGQPADICRGFLNRETSLSAGAPIP